MTVKSLVTAGLAAVTLGGCAGAVRLQTELAPSTYDYANFTTYHAGRDTKVEVYGNPFNMDAATFAKAVTDNMQGANAGQRTNFTTKPGPSAEKNLRVVMAFNSDAEGYDLCTGHNFRPRNQGGPLTLNAAWCFGNRQDSMVVATVDGAKSVNDPRFHDLVDQTVLNLFPPHMDYELIRDHDDTDRPS